jgi:hypothetical protein
LDKYNDIRASRNPHLYPIKIEPDVIHIARDNGDFATCAPGINQDG